MQEMIGKEQCEGNFTLQMEWADVDFRSNDLATYKWEFCEEILQSDIALVFESIYIRVPVFRQ